MRHRLHSTRPKDPRQNGSSRPQLLRCPEFRHSRVRVPHKWQQDFGILPFRSVHETTVWGLAFSKPDSCKDTDRCGAIWRYLDFESPFQIRRRVLETNGYCYKTQITRHRMALRMKCAQATIAY